MTTIAIILVAFLNTPLVVDTDAARVTAYRQPQKDECMLNGKDCPVMTIQEKIEGLRREARKGEAVYRPEELKKLEEKLKESEGLMEELTTR